MEINKNISKNSIPNLQFYKKENGLNYTTSFDAFTINNKSDNYNLSGSYLALGNDDSKNIFMYKINSKDDIKLIHTIKLDYDNINLIKYFYDSFNHFHYLVILINNRTKVLIYKIIDEFKYDLIFSHSEIRSQGGFNVVERPVQFKLCELMFNKEESFLILLYILQQGCCLRVVYFDIFDFIKNKRYVLGSLNSSEEEFFYYDDLLDEGINSIFDIKREDKSYLGFFNRDAFYLYFMTSSNLIPYMEENYRIYDEKKQTAKVIKINIGNNLENLIGGFYKGFLINEHNGEEFIYIYQFKDKDFYFLSEMEDKGNINTSIIIKIDLKNSQIIFISTINTRGIITMKEWNEKYSLIFEEKSKRISLFNNKAAIVAKVYNHGDDLFKDGKKIIINDNEELLFVTDEKGQLNIWVNSQN